MGLLTQGGAVRSVGRQPEHDEREAGEEDTRQREDVGREHHVALELEGVGEHGVLRAELLRLGQHLALSHRPLDRPLTHVLEVRVKRGQIEP